MPKHSLLRLTQKLYLTPHLINQQSFINIESYLSLRNAGLMLPDLPNQEGEPAEAPDDLDDIVGVGVIDICGPLVNKASMWDAMCGMCSYEGILEQADEMIEAGCSTIVMNIDSGGGEAYGAFDCADSLREMCDEAGVSLIAYVDGMAASAAYAIACAADEVVCNAYGEVGSIGVLIALCDQSKALEKAGLKPVFISAGDNKIPYNEDNTFKQAFLDDLQMKVDTLYGAFVDHVAEYTSMTPKQIKDTQAKTFMANDALELGLINKVMSVSDFVDYIVAKQKGDINA